MMSTLAFRSGHGDGMIREIAPVRPPSAAIALLALLFTPNQGPAIPIISRLEISPVQPTPADEITLRIDVELPCPAFSLSRDLRVNRIQQTFFVGAFYERYGEVCAAVPISGNALGTFGKLPAGAYQVEATLFQRIPPAGFLGAPIDHRNTSFTVVPEPATLPLIAAGLGMMGWLVHRRRRIRSGSAVGLQWHPWH
jgi:hypothetical protein